MRGIALLLLASVANAKTLAVPIAVPVHDLDLHRIRKDIAAAGYQVGPTMCSDAWKACRVEVPDASTLRVSDLEPIFTAAKTRSQRAADFKALRDKLAAGTATQAEKDEMLLRFMEGRR